MIESGSSVPGTDFSKIGLPKGTAFRLEMPSDALRSFVSDYHVFDSEGISPDWTEWVLPNWAAIRLTFCDTPMRVDAGAWVYDPLPPASVYGVTSRAMQMTRLNGVTVGMRLTPLGWARLFNTSAEACRDRIVPLQDLWGQDVADSLHRAVADSDRASDVKAVLDRFLLARLGAPRHDEATIARMWQVYRTGDTVDVAKAAYAVGLEERQFRRFSQRFFGFPPKTLLVRARFMRAMLPLLASQDVPDSSLVPLGYYDVSHFQRDARRFLGMSPRRFLRSERSYSAAVLRGYLQVADSIRRSGRLAATGESTAREDDRDR